jgi:hypothetical protein
MRDLAIPLPVIVIAESSACRQRPGVRAWSTDAAPGCAMQPQETMERHVGL